METPEMEIGMERLVGRIRSVLQEEEGLTGEFVLVAFGRQGEVFAPYAVAACGLTNGGVIAALEFAAERARSGESMESFVIPNTADEVM